MRVNFSFGKPADHGDYRPFEAATALFWRGRGAGTKRSTPSDRPVMIRAGSGFRSRGASVGDGLFRRISMPRKAPARKRPANEYPTSSSGPAVKRISVRLVGGGGGLQDVGA